MEPIRPLGKTAQYLACGVASNFTGKERHFLAGAGTSGYFADLKREELTQISKYYRQGLMASIWLGFWLWETVKS